MAAVDPGVTGRKSAGGRQKSHTAQDGPPSERGSHAYSVPAAGRMIGLSRGASYAAAHAGQIPTQQYGNRLVVPKALWHARLGIVSE